MNMQKLSVNKACAGMTAVFVLQSISMTGKQLKAMLLYEGLYYALGTMTASAVFGTLFSLTAVRGITGGIWFFSYQFVVWPMFMIYPFLIVLTAVIPAVICSRIMKAGIIDRPR